MKSSYAVCWQTMPIVMLILPPLNSKKRFSVISIKPHSQGIAKVRIDSFGSPRSSKSNESSAACVLTLRAAASYILKKGSTSVQRPKNWLPTDTLLHFLGVERHRIGISGISSFFWRTWLATAPISGCLAFGLNWSAQVFILGLLQEQRHEFRLFDAAPDFTGGNALPPELSAKSCRRQLHEKIALGIGRTRISAFVSRICCFSSFRRSLYPISDTPTTWRICICIICILSLLHNLKVFLCPGFIHFTEGFVQGFPSLCHTSSQMSSVIWIERIFTGFQLFFNKFTSNGPEKMQKHRRFRCFGFWSLWPYRWILHLIFRFELFKFICFPIIHICQWALLTLRVTQWKEIWGIIRARVWRRGRHGSSKHTHLLWWAGKVPWVKMSQIKLHRDRWYMLLLSSFPHGDSGTNASNIPHIFNDQKHVAWRSQSLQDDSPQARFQISPMEVAEDLTVAHWKSNGGSWKTHYHIYCNLYM